MRRPLVLLVLDAARACLRVAALWLGLITPAAAQPAVTPHFSSGTLATAIPLGPDVLSPQERAFIATLPEIRVAIPLPASRPYEVVSEDGEISGIHPEMLSYLARAFGLRLRPVLLASWTRTLEAAERREVDLVMTLGYTADRARYLEFTLGVTPLPGALFTRTGPPVTDTSEAQLAHGRIAVERNFLASDFLRRQYPKALQVTVEDTGDALTALADGRADYYLGSLLETIDWLVRRPVPGIELNRLMNYGTGYYHFAVRKDWAPLVGVLNKGISTLRADGAVPLTQRREWRQAIASMPPGVSVPAPMALTAAELDRLSQQPVWRVGAVRGLPLLNHVEVSGQHTGIAAEMTEQVVRRLGVGLAVVPFDNVGRMLDALRRGEIDVIPFLTRTAEREREFAFSQPYVEMPYVIVARTDAPLYWSLDSLRGRRLALAPQHPLMPVIRERYPDIVIVPVDDGNQAMDAVADRRADAAVEVKLFANLRINGESGDRLRTVAVVEEVPATFHFATTQARRPLLGLVDRALADIPEAERQRMQRRWVAVDLDPEFPWRRHAPVIAVATAAMLVLALATAWWLRRLSAEVRLRRRTEARLRDIAATVPGVAFRHLIDGRGRIFAGYVTPGAARVLGVGLQPGQTILSSIAPRVAEPHRAAFEAEQRRCIDSGEPFRATVPYEHPDGGRRWLTCEAVRTPAESGVLAWTGYIVDTSREQTLQARLVEAARARNVLLASASHELRAPAHTLALALQALNAEAHEPAQQGPLRIAQDAVETLSQLLDDVLDAARFDKAALRLRPRHFSLHGLLRTVAEGATTSAAAKRLDFAMRFDGEVPDEVHMDPLRLKQILLNLLSNAFKYTAEGRVELIVSPVEPEPGAPRGAQRLRFIVADSGPGIPVDRQATLFAPFVTAHASDAPAPREGSSGLGLANCRQLAEAMGGSIDLDSQPGRGTRVTLQLPLVSPADDTPVPPRRNGALLVCDDDPTSRMLLAHLLRAQGFAVVEVECAEAALERWQLGGLAAIVTDLEMPGLGGVEILRRVRGASVDPALRPVLVVCSGDASDPDHADDADALADERLMKPVHLPTLLKCLARHGVLPPEA